MSDQDNNRTPQEQKRSVFRTVLTLLAVVLGIYLFFIGRAVVNVGA